MNTATSSGPVKRRFVTVVYEIIDDAAWRSGGNPLSYKHNGLKSVCVSAGDLASLNEEIEGTVQDGEDRTLRQETERLKVELATRTEWMRKLATEHGFSGLMACPPESFIKRKLLRLKASNEALVGALEETLPILFEHAVELKRFWSAGDKFGEVATAEALHAKIKALVYPST